jgi:hypothetical protein
MGLTLTASGNEIGITPSSVYPFYILTKCEANGKAETQNHRRTDETDYGRGRASLARGRYDSYQAAD